MILDPVPPLEGFVMNRVIGDTFENLLYKIFVSIDENTTIQELGNLLQIDVQLVKVKTSFFQSFSLFPLGRAKLKAISFP